MAVLEIPALPSFCLLGVTEEGNQTRAVCLPHHSYSADSFQQRLMLAMKIAPITIGKLI